MSTRDVEVRDAYTALGLSDSEYDRILDFMGRAPNFLELSLFSVMWSEHCGYKNSRPLLRRFPNRGPRVLQGPGENAGVVEVGEGWALVFKMESHNHPSAVEPYEGAATGVGGIIRDVLAMGARPVALLDSLRFGPLTEERNRYLFREVVRGIGGYGNAIGVPTVGGEVEFAPAYSGNPLVNAMCIGLVRAEDFLRARAVGDGNLVVLFGAKTGRDGIHGATFASDELSEGSEEKRPNVQVGDPFAGKMMVECSLKLLDEDLLVSLQDLGAAGITSSASEMAARGGFGIEIDTEAVPLREEGMEPWEVSISESQERMLAIVEPQKVEEVLRVCERYELAAAVVGRVTAGHQDLRFLQAGEVAGTVPAPHLADAPVYERETTPPAYLEEVRRLEEAEIPVPGDHNEVLLQMLSHPNLCSRSSVYEQYDHEVGANTVVRPGADAAVLRIKGTTLGFAATTDCRGRHCYLDPEGGGAAAVAEAYRNLSCVGATPVAITDCLNFGNPEKPDAYYQFAASINGISEACEALRTPVVSGNVSLYNENEGVAVYPTPAVGMVGVFEDVARHATPTIKREGDALVLVGDFGPILGGTDYLEIVHGKTAGAPFVPDLHAEKAASDAVRSAIEGGIVDTAHDLSGGGLAVALAEMALKGDSGVVVDLPPVGMREDVALFGETGGCVLIALPEARFGELEEHLDGVHHARIGRTGGGRLVVPGLLDLSLDELSQAYEKDLFERHAPEGGHLG